MIPSTFPLAGAVRRTATTLVFAGLCGLVIGTVPVRAADALGGSRSDDDSAAPAADTAGREETVIAAAREVAVGSLPTTTPPSNGAPSRQRVLTASLTRALGTLPPGKSVTVKINATVDAVPLGTTELAAQGTVSGTNFSDVLTDDPDVGGSSDPTVTPADDTGAANDAPVAADDAYGADEDTSLTVNAANGVLSNDTDADGDSLTAGLVSDVSSGALTLNADGSFTYTPDAGFTGADTFTYAANDGTVDSNTAAVTITVRACPSTISPTAAAFDSFGATGTVQVDIEAGCDWTAVSNDSWITIDAGSTGTGPGTVSYRISSNASADPRTGTMTIAGQTFTVDQQGVGDELGIAPLAVSFPGAGGAGRVSVAATSDADWEAVSNAPWIVIRRGSSGTGNGAVIYEVLPNPTDAPRTGTITIGGETFTVGQAASGETSFGLWSDGGQP